MNLKQLQYFRELAYTEHITNTAEKLSITQPTLSHSMAELEKELGTFLFEKSGRNIRLTKYGRFFLTYTEKALDELEKGEKKLREMTSPTYGAIDLAYIYTLGPYFVPALIKNFAKQNSNQHLTYSFYQGTTKTIINELKEEKFDLAFCSMPKKDPDIEFVPLAEQKLVVIVAENHPLAKLDSIDLKDTADYPFIYYNKTSGLRPTIDKLFKQVDVEPKISCEVEEDQAMAGLVAIDYGIAIIPEMEFLNHFPVKIIPIHNPYYHRFIYMANLKNHYLSPVTNKFRNYVINYCQEKFLRTGKDISHIVNI